MIWTIANAKFTLKFQSALSNFFRMTLPLLPLHGSSPWCPWNRDQNHRPPSTDRSSAAPKPPPDSSPTRWTSSWTVAPCVVAPSSASAGSSPPLTVSSSIKPRPIPFRLLNSRGFFSRTSVVVRMGTLNWRLATEPNRVIMTTTNKIVHTQYNASSLYNDVALLQLPSDAPLNSISWI